MNVLEALASGLRGAGGTLSPEAFRNNAMEDRQRAQLEQQLKLKDYQQKIQDQREQQLATAVRPHLESGNLDAAAAAAASTPGGFQTGMTLLNQSEARRARLDQAQQALDQRTQELGIRHQQRMDELTQRGADQAALAAANRQHQAQMQELNRQGQMSIARLAASLRPERQYPIVNTPQGIFERRPEGLVPLKMPNGQPLKTGTDKPMTEFQGKNMLFGTRSAEAHNIIDEMQDNINFTSLYAKQKMGAAGRAAMTEAERQMDQAQRNFVNAVLRQESGAVISEPEFKNAQIQYFPQPGDDAKTLENKRQNRETAINGFQKIAGPGGEDIKVIRAKNKKTKVATPEGVDPQVWAVMTPEEKALWK